jgi:hypothetical protein
MKRLLLLLALYGILVSPAVASPMLTCQQAKAFASGRMDALQDDDFFRSYRIVRCRRVSRSQVRLLIREFDTWVLINPREISEANIKQLPVVSWWSTIGPGPSTNDPFLPGLIQPTKQVKHGT